MVTESNFDIFFPPFSANQLDGEIEVSENVTAASCHVLPNAEFDGLWDSLIYDSNIKEEALRYVETAMIASECKVDTMLIGLNRLILLSGPPGIQTKSKVCPLKTLFKSKKKPVISLLWELEVFTKNLSYCVHAVCLDNNGQ